MWVVLLRRIGSRQWIMTGPYDNQRDAKASVDRLVMKCDTKIISVQEIAVSQGLDDICVCCQTRKRAYGSGWCRRCGGT